MVTVGHFKNEVLVFITNTSFTHCSQKVANIQVEYHKPFTFRLQYLFQH